MAANPSKILENYRAELRLLDDLLAKGPGTYTIRLQTHANCISTRHRIYKARSADRAIQRATGQECQYDKIRILAPTLSHNGLTYQMTILVLENAEAIVGLLEDPK